MKYLIPLLLFLNGCATISTMDHPIDSEEQQKLELSQAPILRVDAFKLSVILSILAALILATWFFVRSNQNKEASTG